MNRINYAVCRDYKEGDTFPYVEVNDPALYTNFERRVHYRLCDDTKYQCWQPDHLDGAEFNLILLFPDRPVVARGLHFEYC
jgi:hypothetical protein